MHTKKHQERRRYLTVIASLFRLEPPGQLDQCKVLLLSRASLQIDVDVQARQAISRYYDGALKSDDSLLPCETRNVCLRSLDDGSAPGSAPPNTASAGAVVKLCQSTLLKIVVGRGTMACALGTAAFELLQQVQLTSMHCCGSEGCLSILSLQTLICGTVMALVGLCVILSAAKGCLNHVCLSTWQCACDDVLHRCTHIATL